MSEETESFETVEKDVKQLSHKRILLIMALVVIAGAIFGFVRVSASFGWGVLIGGILSFINYYWLKNSLRAVFDRIVRDETPGFLATKYILRYVAFGAVLAIVYLTKTVPVVSVILGLASFAFAIVIEGIIRIFKTHN